jgi:arabinose-5-phosphate isomerase
MSQKKFSKEKFKVYHPGGNIGNSLLLAKDIMVTGKSMPIINYKRNFKDAVKIMNKKKLGVIVIIKDKFIKGLMTDGDLRRMMNNHPSEKNLISFTKNYPLTINENMPASKALAIMNKKKITSLLVVSDKDYHKSNKILKGIIHIHFLLNYGVN